MSDSASEQLAIASDCEINVSFSEEEDRPSTPERTMAKKVRPSRQKTLPAKLRDARNGVDSIEELQTDLSSELSLSL